MCPNCEIYFKMSNQILKVNKTKIYLLRFKLSHNILKDPLHIFNILTAQNKQ